MGQYYLPIIGDAKGRRKQVFDLCIQLTVYCDWDTMPCLGLVKKIYKNPKRLVWVGDYVLNTEVGDEFRKERHIPEDVLGFWPQSVWRKKKIPWENDTQIPLVGKFYVNHDTKEFIDIDEFRRSCEARIKEGEWIPSPICLLMAVGNDAMTDGDYKNENTDKVGLWAWNLVSVEDEQPKGYTELTDIWFRGSK